MANVTEPPEGFKRLYLRSAEHLYTVKTSYRSKMNPKNCSTILHSQLNHHV